MKRNPLILLVSLVLTLLFPSIGRTQTVTLSNGTGDGSVQITVDAYGSFGSSTPAGDAVYDPIGPQGPAGTVFESGIYFSPLANFLTTDSFGAQLPPVEFIAQGSDFVQSQFDVVGFHFELTQRLNPKGTGGSSFVQQHRITNNTGVAQTLTIVRHVDGDLFFVGAFDNDFGGVSSDGNALFEFDTGDDPSAPTTLVGITSEGGTPTGFSIQPFRFTDDIAANNGIPASLLNQVNSNGDGDGITDFGYDVTLSLQNGFTVAVGETIIYTTTTQFGEGSTGSLALEIVDPACASKTACNGDFLEATGGLKADPNELTRANVRRDGVATDGVTQLLLRVQSDTPVTFNLEAPDGSIPFGTGQWGALSKRDGSSPCSIAPCGSITVTPESTTDFGNVAFAVYHAPLNFPLASAASTIAVTVEATTSSATASDGLDLRPPPVLLVHGVWSSPTQAWRQYDEQGKVIGGLEKFLIDNGFEPFLVNHSDIDGSAGSFDPALESKVINRLIGTTNLAREVYRSKGEGIAVTQVDVIGHSMGGLITRARTAYGKFNPYRRRDNYNQGDFHKIVSIGTPHLGTPLADRLIENNCDSFLGKTLQEWFESFSKPFGPALVGFQTGSKAIRNIGSTDVPSHAIVGIAPDDPDTEENLDWIARVLVVPSFTVDGQLGGNGNHDTIVPIQNQEGGLLGECFPLTTGSISCVTGVVHANFDIVSAIDVGETESQDTFNEVHGLLLKPIDSPSFGNFTELQEGGEFRELLNCSQEITTAAARAAAETVAAAATVIITPLAGTLVHPGDQVQVKFDITGGSPVDGALLSIDGLFHTFEGQPPYVVEFKVPSNRADRIDVIGLTSGPGPENYTAETYLIVQPSAAPTSISASPSSYTFSQVGESFAIQVTGEFEGGSQIDLTSGAAGTSYATLSGNNNVISVTPEGVVEALGPGQDTIVISNAGQSTAVLVSVTIVNFAPMIEPLSDVTMTAGEAININVTATDTDGNNITLALSNAPPFATLSDNGDGTGLLILNPGPADVGVFTFGIVATDDGEPSYGTSRTLSVTVNAAPSVPHDLAVVKISAPLAVRGDDPVTRHVKVKIQNRSPHNEEITVADLGNGIATGLVRLNVAAVDDDGEDCAAATVALDPHHNLKKTKVLKPKQTLTVNYLVTYNCAAPRKRDPKDPSPGDYSHTASVHHEVLDGNADTHTADDTCPRSAIPPFEVDPNPDGTIKDKGCGARKADKTFGDPVLTNVIRQH